MSINTNKPQRPEKTNPTSKPAERNDQKGRERNPAQDEMGDERDEPILNEDDAPEGEGAENTPLRKSDDTHH